MPAESTRTDRTILEFAGRLDQSLSGAANAAERALGNVQAASTRATNSMSGGFARAGVAAEVMAGKVRATSALMAGAAGGAAVAAVMMAYEKGKQFFDAAIEAASDERGPLTSRKLLVYLENIPELAKMGAKEIKAQAADISEVSEKMQALSGTSAAIFKSGFANMVSFGAMGKGIEKIALPMADFLAGTVGTKASFEDIADLSTKIGEAVTTGSVGRFGKLLGITPADAKAFKAMTSSAERLDFLGEKIEKRFKGQAASQGGSLGGQLLKAQTDQAAILASYGDVFRGIELQWTTALTKMESATLPIFKPIVEWVSTTFGNIKGYISDIIGGIATSGVWKKWSEEIDKIDSHFHGIGDVVKKIVEWFQNADSAGRVAERILNAANSTLETVKKIGDIFNKIGDTWNGVVDGAVKFEQMAERIGRLLFGIKPNPEDAAAIVKDQKERAARGGTVGDKPGTFPSSPAEDKRTDKWQMGHFPIPGDNSGNYGTVKSGAYDEAFRAASAQSGIPFSTLKAIGLQENVNPVYNNPMGRSNDSGVFHYTKAEANEMIMRQAMLPYMRGFRPDATPEERSRAFKIYSPPGAKNDIYGTNASKQSETDAIERRLNAQPTSSSKPASSHTFGDTHIHIAGNADKSTIALIREELAKHRANVADMLEDLRRADDQDFRTSFS